MAPHLTKYRNSSSAIRFLSIIFLAFFVSAGCKKETRELNHANSKNDIQANQSLPNIVLILADDIGYEVPSYTGGQSYQTPNIDRLAQSSMQFTQCETAPNCSPSRVMLLTGKYNFRNYIDWGILDTSQYTIANLLRRAGYSTCVAGKWQLDGGDASLKRFGFEKYRVFLPFNINENDENWYRYKNPHLYENGKFLADNLTNGKYADDMFVNYISKFIDSNLDRPFFVYYPMSLCHYPFCPTPDDPEYSNWTPESHKSDTIFFPSMVKYMDKKVGQLVNRIQEKGLISNTIIFFLGDNGTPKQITSLFNNKIIQGGKGKTYTYGTHVPFIVRWDTQIAGGTVNKNIINLPDFMSTLADIAGIQIPGKAGTIDGISFYSSFFHPDDAIRDWGFCQFQPHSTGLLRRWAQTVNYKLYDTMNNSKFYNISIDPLEQNRITNKNIKPSEKVVKQQLENILNQMHK
jgi:arylsulfatase A